MFFVSLGKCICFVVLYPLSIYLIKAGSAALRPAGGGTLSEWVAMGNLSIRGSMINADQAEAIAIKELVSSDVELVLTGVQEVLDGWIFYHQSKEFMDGAGESMRLAGNLPFIVLRSTGGVEDLHTGKSMQQWLAAYGGAVE